MNQRKVVAVSVAASSLALSLGLVVPARAEGSANLMCQNPTTLQWQPCSLNNPLPAQLVVGGGVTGAVKILGNAGATLDATLGAGAAPANGLGVLAQFNSSLPTLTNGQTASLQADSNGRLITTGLTQSTATAGQLGSLVMGGVLTTTPGGGAYTAGNTNPIVMNPSGQMMVDTEGLRNTYRFASGPNTSFAASGTDAFVLTGSASKTVRVDRMSVCGTATSGSVIDVRVVVHTSPNTSGTSVGVSGFPLDQNNAAVTASAAVYTANPTINDGTTRVYDIRKLALGAVSSGQAGCVDWKFGDTNGQALTLRGTSQQVAVNLNGITMPAGTSLDYVIEETEE